MTTIGKSAFTGCSGITQLTLTAGLTTIGESAFSGDSALALELVLPAILTKIGKSAFSSCVGVTGKVNIPAGVTTIEWGAFGGCQNITAVTLHGGITKIGEQPPPTQMPTGKPMPRMLWKFSNSP